MKASFLSGLFAQGLGRGIILSALLGAGALAGNAVEIHRVVTDHTYGSGTASTEIGEQTVTTAGAVQASSGAQVTFSAGTRITLSPGFTAQSGTSFHASISTAAADTDGDGMPDYWENQYGFDINNPADALLDANGNGLTNLQEYLAGNDPLAVTSNLAYELRYDTNQRNQVTAIKAANNGVWAAYAYHADARRQSRWLSNNTQADYSYDAAGRLDTLHNYRVPDGSWIQKQEYGYDLRDRRVWTQRDGNLGDTYTYQADSQLIDYKLDASNPRSIPSGWTQQVSYAYDAAGNRTSVTDNGAVTSYAVDHANQYTSVTGAAIQYGDGRGNVTQWNEWSYTYDANNRMLSATKAGTSITFAYDPAGRLAKRVTNGQVEYFSYDGVQQIVRVDHNGALLSSTIWGPSPDEVLIDYTPQHGTRFFHGDIQGNTLAVTNDNRDILERYRYDPYGNTSFYDANWNQRPASIYGIRFLFTGQEHMSTAGGLYNYKNRFYSVELGRFLQSDPSHLIAGDINLYRYVYNDPINRSDPSGLWSPEGHDELLDYAYSGKTAYYNRRLSDEDIAKVQQGSRDFDIATQAPNQSHLHSMARRGQSPQDAIKDRDKFVSDMVVLGRAAVKAGHRDTALYVLGMAAHPIMDGDSPEHTDKNGNPKTWAPKWYNPLSWWGHSPVEHIGGETKKDITQGVQHSQLEKLNSLYDNIFNPPPPPPPDPNEIKEQGK